jgi:tight adherence protein B
VRRVAGALALVVLWAAAPASAAASVTIDDVDASAAPQLDVTISVPGGNADLQASDFAVVVDGSRRTASVYALIRDPMEVVVAIDTSGSMNGDALTQARSAALGFVDSLPTTAKVAILSFGDAATPLTTMGASRDEIASALDSLTAGGETALYDAVVASTGLYTGADARRVLVVLSDGGDTVSDATLAGAAAAAADADVDVRAVALATSESDTAALQALTSSGSVTTASGAAGLAAAYDAVAQELTGRYRLSFTTQGSGSATITIYVNTAQGVLADSRVVDLGTGTVIGSVTPDPAPTDFGITAPAPTTEVAEAGRFAQSWALPAGAALVFAGILGSLWLSGRPRSEKPEPMTPLDGIAAEEAPRRTALTRLAAKVGILGDRVAGKKRDNSIDRALDRAGISLRAGEFVVVSATIVVVGITTGLVLAGPVGATGLGLAALFLPRFGLRMRTDRRRRAFSDQLEGTLQTIAGSLRAGYGLVQAISTVASESPTPTSDEFNRVVVESRMGRSVEKSMGAMAQRLENEDLQWVVEAIEIQREVGGNLAEVLDTVTGTIRDRNLIRRQVKALSAEGRISAFILLALPFVIAAFIAMISPDYLNELTSTTVGRIMLGVAAALMAAGAAWIRKIIRVKF